MSLDRGPFGRANAHVPVVWHPLLGKIAEGAENQSGGLLRHLHSQCRPSNVRDAFHEWEARPPRWSSSPRKRLEPQLPDLPEFLSRSECAYPGLREEAVENVSGFAGNPRELAQQPFKVRRFDERTALGIALRMRPQQQVRLHRRVDGQG